MIREIRVVMRKELKEILAEGGGRRARLTPLIGLAATGVFFPLNFGLRYLQPEVMLVMGAMVPALFTLPIVADAFAGERERHTLETLLATRLPDRAILFGKLAAIVAYAWALTVIAFAIGIVSINVAHAEVRPVFFPPLALAGALAESILVAVLMTGIGLHISLGSATVRQAQQRLSLVLLVPLALPALARVLPAPWKAAIGDLLVSSRITPTALLFVLLVVLDAAVLYASVLRFRRARLVTD